MKITAHSTTKIVSVKGRGEAQTSVPARIWEGVTESGIPCILFVTRIAVAAKEDQAEFEQGLQVHATPSAVVDVFPLSLVL